MAKSRYRLTAEIATSIPSYIRAGGYPHIAAEAAGVPRDVFEEWLRRGQETPTPAIYRRFFEAVRQAKAQARLAAEIAALKGKPMDWLRSGPGKETAHVPGWTSTVRAATSSASGDLARPEVQGLIQALLDLLAPYPEARVAVAQALMETTAS